MKLNILRLLVVTLACACAVVVMTKVRAENHSARGASAEPLAPRPAQAQASAAATQEKTTEQVQKNIKVLTGLPQSQLIPVMNYMASSLGRRCNYCHVNNNGQWDYASDEKPEKSTAREMIKLVLDVNKNTFKGNVEVGCYTCHRGRNSPQSLPTLPLPLPSPPPGNAGGAASAPASAAGSPAAQASPRPSPPPLPSADDVFNKYLAAIGGQAAIDKLTSRAAKGTLVQANGATLQFEMYQSGPEKFYVVATTPQGPFERGFNGQVGWEKTARGVREVTGGELTNLKMSNALFSLIKLKEQYARPPRVRRDRIGDREVYVTDGVMADGRRLRLFFDSASGLLLRRVTILSTMVGNIPEQADFEDYREVDGVKFPFTARSSTTEAGNPTSTRTFTEIKLNGPVDDAKFNRLPDSKPNP
jgi:photosynthetic reaction center cytochrome c subunit